MESERHSVGAEAWVTLAELLRPQGRRGEVLAELLTDFPERFESRPEVMLRAASGKVTAARIETHWLPVGRNVGRVVLKFAGVDSITAAEALSGLTVVIAPDERMQLGEDETYVADLVGCVVLWRGSVVGIIEDVHFATNADGSTRLPDAPELLLVRAEDGREHLIPYVKAWVESQDLKERRIHMRLPDGLLEINP